MEPLTGWQNTCTRGPVCEPRNPSCQQSRIGRVAALNTSIFSTDSTALGAASVTGATENPPMCIAGLAHDLHRDCTVLLSGTARAIETQKVGTADTSWGRVSHRPLTNLLTSARSISWQQTLVQYCHSTNTIFRTTLLLLRCQLRPPTPGTFAVDPASGIHTRHRPAASLPRSPPRISSPACTCSNRQCRCTYWFCEFSY
jgi:hypothetical protein